MSSVLHCLLVYSRRSLLCWQQRLRGGGRLSRRCSTDLARSQWFWDVGTRWYGRSTYFILFWTIMPMCYEYLLVPFRCSVGGHFFTLLHTMGISTQWRSLSRAASCLLIREARYKWICCMSTKEDTCILHVWWQDNIIKNYCYVWHGLYTYFILRVILPIW